MVAVVASAVNGKVKVMQCSDIVETSRKAIIKQRKHEFR